MTTDNYSIYSPFDINRHKQTYTDYLEIIIDEDGKIEYAVPSHNEKLSSIACKKLKITKTQLYDMCPEAYYFDYMRWLVMTTHCCAVWNTFAICHEPTRAQITTLRQLKMGGLYKGTIPKGWNENEQSQ